MSVTEVWHYGNSDGMNIIAIANQKGGTAKTTTAAALSVLLSRAGVRTHLIDMDPQASLTTAFGQKDPKGLLYRALWERAALPVVTISDHLTMTPSSIDLSRGETQFISEPGREYLLATCLKRTGLPEDATVILDCPPSLGILSIACLTAATWLCVVVQPGGFELRTLVHLDETVQILRERVNSNLSVIGAVLTNCHPRRAITDDIRSEVSRRWPILGQVRADARLLYATTAGKVHYLTRSKAMEDYAKVVERLRERLSWPEAPLPASAASLAN
jgi:chromosome partitioning protein